MLTERESLKMFSDSLISSKMFYHKIHLLNETISLTTQYVNEFGIYFDMHEFTDGN